MHTRCDSNRRGSDYNVRKKSVIAHWPTSSYQTCYVPLFWNRTSMTSGSARKIRRLIQYLLFYYFVLIQLIFLQVLSSPSPLSRCETEWLQHKLLAAISDYHQLPDIASIMRLKNKVLSIVQGNKLPPLTALWRLLESIIPNKLDCTLEIKRWLATVRKHWWNSRKTNSTSNFCPRIGLTFHVLPSLIRCTVMNWQYKCWAPQSPNFKINL